MTEQIFKEKAKKVLIRYEKQTKIKLDKNKAVQMLCDWYYEHHKTLDMTNFRRILNECKI